MKINQKGFSVIGILIVIVVIGLAGGVGWYVQSKSRSDKSISTTGIAPDNTASTDKSTEKSTETTIPADYIWYENKVIGFKFAYPKSWGTIQRTGDDNPDLITNGLNGHPLRTVFQNGDKNTFPRGNELSGDTGVGTDEGLYAGGYLEKDGKYYSVAKYTAKEVEIPKEKILSMVTSGLGKVLILKTDTIAGTEIQVLLNLPKGKSLTGLDMGFTTGNYDFAEEGKIDGNGLKVLEQVAKTFNAL
jgi:hypothetical protein